MFRTCLDIILGMLSVPLVLINVHQRMGDVLHKVTNASMTKSGSHLAHPYTL